MAEFSGRRDAPRGAGRPRPSGGSSSSRSGGSGGSSAGRGGQRGSSPYRASDQEPRRSGTGRAFGRPSQGGGSAAGGSAGRDARGASDASDRPYRERPERTYGERSERPSGDRPRGGDGRGAGSYSGDRSAGARRGERDSNQRSDGRGRGARSFDSRGDRAGGNRDGSSRDSGHRGYGPRGSAAGGSARDSGPRPNRTGESRPSYDSARSRDRDPDRNFERPARPRPQSGGTRHVSRPGNEQSGERVRRPLREATEIAVPNDADPRLLDPQVRGELRTLSKPNAEIVAGHLVAAGQLIDSNPQRALEHARAARNRAARVAAVREAVGLAAYHSGEWAEALNELRTARRISGSPHNLPLIADCERALGKASQALKVLSDRDVGRLDPETRAELFIVIASARRDLGQIDAALGVLARNGMDRDNPRPGAARVWYVYADILESIGRTEEAAQWFAASAGLDPTGLTDAADRAANLL